MGLKLLKQNIIAYFKDVTELLSYKIKAKTFQGVWRL